MRTREVRVGSVLRLVSGETRSDSSRWVSHTAVLCREFHCRVAAAGSSGEGWTSNHSDY